MPVKFYPEVKKTTMDYIVKGIRHVCENFKKRSPGSATEREAQEYFAKELAKWSDDVKTEEFELHPTSFMGFMPIAGFLVIVSIGLFVLNKYIPSIFFSILSPALTLISVLMFLSQFLFYRKYFDFLFPKAVSKNVYAVRKPAGEVRRRIIFGGHADASWEWSYSMYGQMAALAPIICGSIGGMFFKFISDVVYLLSGSPPVQGGWNIVMICQIALLPFCVAIMFFINWRVIVDGANDNLSACYAAMAIMKEMAENDFRFENTEVGCLITGSEEAGLRGAKHFAKKHAKELLEAETVIVPFETLRETEQLAVYNRDETGMVHNDERVAELLIKAGKAAGIKLSRAPVYPGSTDAAAFTQAGLPSAGLGGVNHNPQKYYHTRYDTWDNIGEDCIEKSIEIGIRAAILYDKSGLGNTTE